MSGESPGRVTAFGGLLGVLVGAISGGPAAWSARIPARGDLPDFFWPMKAYTAARWAAGEIPLWNPLAGCGEPWLAQLQSGVLYPGDLPFLLGMPWGALLAITLHLAFASAGMARWLDSLGSSRPASLAGGVVYAGAGAFLSLFPYYNNACAAAWLPWIFVGARRLVSGGGLAGFALPVALAFLAGEPSVALAGAAAALGLAALTWSEGTGVPSIRPGRAAARAALGLGLAFALTAAASLPFLELVVRTGRISNASPEEAMARPVGSGALADLVAPPTPAATRTPAGERGGYLASLALGPLALLLVAGAAAGFPGRPRLLLGLLGLAVIGLLLALGSRGALAPLLYRTGLLRGLRFPGRWFLLTHLGLAVAAGAGLDGFLYGRFRVCARPEDDGFARERAWVGRAWIGAGLTVCVVVLLAVAALGSLRDRDPGRARLAFGALGAAVLLLALRGRTGLGAPATGYLVVALLVATLPATARDPLEAVPAAALRSSTEEVRRMFGSAPGRLLVDTLDARAVVGYAMPGGAWAPTTPLKERVLLAGYTNLDAGIPAATSGSPLQSLLRLALLHDSLAGRIPDSILRLCDARLVVSPSPPPRSTRGPAGRGPGVYAYNLAGPLGRAFFARGGRVAADEVVIAALTRPGFDPEDLALFADDPGPIPPPRSGKGFSALRFVRDLAEETEISTVSSEPASVVLTRSWDPGWRVEVDGLPVRAVRTDLFFIGFTVPAGEHRVVLRYRPLSFRVGAALSVISAVILAGLLLAGGPEPRLP